MFDGIPAENRPFRIVLARSGQAFDVPADESVLSVLLRNGVDVPYTCRFGTCGSCVVPVLSGLPDHRDRVLSEELKAGNKLIALCVSRALTDELVVDY
jgi:vanillate O-demethylase ferredoxin subunit